MPITFLLLLSAAAAAASPSYDSLLEDFTRWKRSVKPEGASLGGGGRGLDAELTREDPAAAERAAADCRGFARRAGELITAWPKILDEEQERNAEMVRRQCLGLAGGVRQGAHLLAPVPFLRGIHTGMPGTFARPGFVDASTPAGASVALLRLRKVPGAFAGVLEALREGVRRGVTFSNESMSRVDGQLEEVITDDPEATGYFAPFARMDPGALGEELVNGVRAAARSVISYQIMPALRELREYLKTEYAAALRPEPGMHSLTNGKGQEMYQGCLEFHTSVEGLTAMEVHNIGLEEVAKLRAGVMNVSRELGRGNLTFKEFITSVQEDPDQRFNTSEAILEHVRGILRDRINPAMPMVIPDEYLNDKLYGVNVKAAPGANGIFAYYNKGSKDGSRNGTYYLSVSDVTAFKKFELVSLSLHESNPGHHFDATVFGTTYEFPAFIHAWGFGGGASAPAATPSYNSFLEGWGLYSEYLGFEMGLYRDPYDLLGYYSWNLLRAARLVVDTGLNSLGWGRQAAVDYLLDNTGVSEFTVQKEVDRYVTWPGQATSYKIGERAIRALRAAEEERLGADFDLRRFHVRLLSCRGPLDMLADCVRMRERQEAEMDKKKLLAVKIRLEEEDKSEGAAKEDQEEKQNVEVEEKKEGE